MISTARPRFGARKNTHAKVTKWKVRSTPTQRGTLSSHVQRAIFLAAWTADTPMLCSNPQMTKFQLAPCQRPPSNIVIIKLR